MMRLPRTLVCCQGPEDEDWDTDTAEEQGNLPGSDEK